ncbi:LysR family transcriptional regulator [Microbacterium sp. No. 7]|uniref:LysR family transcriptional regulator n=1 Tax=Microbacterium sp. No. 7 TaxID=1714373 RepID=UPI0006CF210F|nr:LysR family transcriptional regulator [Microbacterium sp. No. 7]ALJ20482.1 hypothetical protein AOA12_11420 [Microbacterium sp. No. 7]
MTGVSREGLIRQLDLFSLRLFLTVVEEEQIGLAAAREHIAPSTATRRIQALEDVLGVPLLERGRTGVLLTEAGQAVARHAHALFEELETLRADIAEIAGRVEGELTVAAAHSVIADLLAPAIGAYMLEWPAVQVRLHELDNVEVLHQAVSGKCDVGVFATVGPVDFGDAAVHLLTSEELVATLPPGHPFSARAAITVPELMTQDLIVTRTLALALEDLARVHGSSVEFLQVVRTGEVALGMVRAGLGVTLTPRGLLTEETRADVLVLEVDDPWATRTVHAVVRDERAAGPAARAFLTALVAATADA